MSNRYASIDMDASKGKIYRGYLHYSNPASQGRLIAITKNYPLDQAINHGWYSDHLRNHKYELYAKCSALLQAGDNWASRLRGASNETLIEFGSIFFDTPVKHVQVVFYFNVQSGYDVLWVGAIE